MKFRAIYKGGDVVAKFENDQLVWAADEYLNHERAQAPMVMGDIPAYRSMVTGEMIGGRRQHREHLLRHNVIEVGNELDKATPKPLTTPGGLKEHIIRATNQHMR